MREQNGAEGLIDMINWGNIRHAIGLLLDDKVDATFKDGSWAKQIL